MPTGKDQAQAEAEINQLIQRYARAVDVLGGGAQAECFTDDGFIDFPGDVRVERAAMLGRERADNLVRRHFFTPPLIKFTSEDTASGEGYCLILERDLTVKERKPPYSVDYGDEYRRTGDGWRIAKRIIRFSFPKG